MKPSFTWSFTLANALKKTATYLNCNLNHTHRDRILDAYLESFVVSKLHLFTLGPLSLSQLKS